MRFLKYIWVIALCLTLGGCSDFLEKKPDDQLTLEMIFEDKVRTEGWLAAIYNRIPDPYWQMVNDIGYDSMGDDLTPSQRWVQWDFNVVNQILGNWNTGSAWNAGFWSELPKRIREAYIFIENVHPNEAQKMTAEYVENMKNEARFLIAYYYWILVNAYGAVPMYTEALPSDAPMEELMIGQQTFDYMINWIDGQLVDLSKKLPAYYDDPNMYGRATSIMCLAVRSRMLLFAASPLVNGNADYIGHKNTQGEEIFNPTYDPNKWQKAADASRELIEAAHEAGHELYKEYKNGEIDPFLSYRNMMFTTYYNGNKEILFARPECNFNEYDGHAIPHGSGGNGGLGVTQSLVDAFFMENGLPAVLGYNQDYSPIINEESGYSESGFSRTADMRSNTNWNESEGVGIVAKRGTYNMYCHREPRFYVTVLWNGAYYRPSGRYVDFYSGGKDGGPTWDAPQNGYLVRKKVHPEDDALNGKYPYRPGILYRLGEAYLNYAEALCHVNPTNPDILTYVNLIRERAGIPTYGTGEEQIKAPTDANELLELVYRERRVELNCEDGIRYNDLRRWKKGVELLNRPFYGMNFSGTKLSDKEDDEAAYFVRKPYLNRVYLKKYYWYPIYQTELDKDPSLVQAPFWDQ